jgi:glutamate 5-kinase
LQLDQGACLAITAKGKSLLPSGILAIEGQFDQGDCVRCVDGQEQPIAVGLVNFCSDDLRKIKGLRSDMIEKVLGFKENDEVLHRDNLVIL